VARRATFIDGRRHSGGTLLVLDSGNALMGDREPAVRTRGISSVQAMNTLGYDAMALGLNDIQQLGLDELEACIAEARFAIVSANAVVSSTGALAAAPYVLLARNGHRIGILGLTDVGESVEIRVGDPRAAARRYLPELATQAEIIILLSHAGVEVDRAVAEEFPEIDLVVSGLLGDAYGGGMIGRAFQVTPDVSTPGYAGLHIGVADLTFDRGNALVLHEWQQVTLDASIAGDPEMAEWAAEAIAAAEPADE